MSSGGSTSKSRGTISTRTSKATNKDSESPPDSLPGARPGGAMLSVNFSTPVSSAARAEKVKQMTNNHPAFVTTRVTQNLLVDIQKTLRRMPGVASSESQEICDKLQEVGQIVSQEISRLVESLANVTLDDQDKQAALGRLSPSDGNNGEAVACMSLDASLAKAKVEDQSRVIDQLQRDLSTSEEKRDQAEEELRKITQELREISHEYHVGARAEDMVKSLENTVKQLEDQVHNRRSLWAMTQTDPERVVQAARTLADSVQGNPEAQSALQSVGLNPQMSAFRPGNANNEPDERMGPGPTRTSVQRAQSTRPMSAFQAPARPGTVAPPPKFGPLTSQPSRAPSAFQGDRSSRGAWGPPGPNPRTLSSGHPSSPFQRPQPHSAGFNPRARGNGHNHYGGMNGPMTAVPNGMRSGGGYDNHDLIVRPPTSMGFRGPLHPQTPTSGPRGRQSRFQELGNRRELDTHGYDPTGGAMTRAGATGMPLVHLNEGTVAAWNERITGFYGVIRMFVERHAGLAYAGSVQQLMGLRLWPVLLSTYHPLGAAEAASYLDLHLANNNSKACLVTRVMIDFAVNKVFTPEAWAGADPDTTAALERLAGDFVATQGRPSAERQHLLDRQGEIIFAIMNRDNAEGFLRHRLRELGEELLGALQPILNRGVDIQCAVRDMETVIESAWELSSAILTSRLTFDFRFPDVGTRFSSQSMLPIWPHLDPIEIQSRHWRVAMVTTPVITCRNDTGANISAHSVSLADVFCMQ